MEKKILAIKGPGGFVAGEIIGMLFSGIMGFILLFLAPRELVIKLFSIIFIGCAIFCGYLAFSNINHPNTMLTYDDNGIYLNYKNNEFIAFKDILYIKQRHAYSRYHTYEFGHIEIITKTKKYKIGVIDDIDNVAYIIRSNVDRVNKEY